jgi:hypothetical protein
MARRGPAGPGMARRGKGFYFKEHAMQTYQVTITGKSPLLMHWDNIAWAEYLKRWRETPDNKKKSIAGDDRSPAFSWLGNLYHDGQLVTLPADNLMRCIMEGGAQVPVPGGKNGKTFKTQTQSGMMVAEQFPALLVNGSAIPVAPILALKDEEDFDKHLEVAIASGFMLFVKRARIGQSKHVRVRPRFDNWSVEFSINVWDEQITIEALRDIMRFAGNYKGIGDWRPSSRTPGPFGRFDAEIRKA